MATILIVDDDDKIRGLLQEILTRKGHQVLTARCGQAGIELFRNGHPAVTILDFEMPDLDGLEVLKEIRTRDLHAPVIMLTGTGTVEREEQARQLGVTEFLAKGFSLHELGSALNLVLSKSASGPARRLSGGWKRSA